MTAFALDAMDGLDGLGDLLMAELTAARWADGTLMVDLDEAVLRRAVVDPVLLPLRSSWAPSVGSCGETRTNPVGTDTSQVRFAHDTRWWTVRARDERFTVLTRQASFKTKGAVVYTIDDADRGCRGPANTLGQGWDFHGTTLEEDAGRLLAALQLDAHRKQWWEAHQDDAAASEPIQRDGSHAFSGRRVLYPPYLDPDQQRESVEVSYRNNVPVTVTGQR